ncbi:MAG: 2-oxoacid:acceptor oxidoreductase subunit alpha [Candidatus Bathyarchaeota archaeon]|nr:2-oxoacid:acceptor oxidoreductase subunit alpha [Candidatus Bathyarchaeota archaeon]
MLGFPQKLKNRVTFRIGGEAGQGITRGGSVLGLALTRAGLNVFGANEFPSIVRGGHNSYTLTVSRKEVYAQDDLVDIVIALNKETVLLNRHEIQKGGGIIYDENIDFGEGELSREGVRLFPIPLTEIVKEIGGPIIMRNSAAMGAAIAYLGLNSEPLEGVITEVFTGKPNVVESNVRAIRMGHDYAREYHKFNGGLNAKELSTSRIMVTGGEAIALGAIGAGCTFYSAYPMTPASGLLHYFISKEQEAEMVVIQAESEIAAVTMAVGAAYAGLRSMTGTSGGGFCLMTEGFGLAGATETPLVVMLGQRPGPSTGMPTYTAQADLLFAIHSSHGEFPRVVVAPGDVDDCFTRTVEVFNLAEKYQIPAIILGDKYLLESHKSTYPFDSGNIEIERGGLINEWKGEKYKRYEITESGVSPKVILGTQGATMLANGNEHDEYGFTTVDPVKVVAMADKRFRKRRRLVDDINGLDPVKLFGEVDSDVTLIGWGSTKGPALEALRLLRREGINARFIQIVYMEPFPVEAFNKAMEGRGRSMLLETNITNQLGRLIREHTDLGFDMTYAKYNGRPFNPREITAEARKLV